MSVGVFRQDWRPQLAPSRLGPLAPVGGGAVLPLTAASALTKSVAALQRTAFSPAVKAAGVAAFAVAASIYTPPQKMALATSVVRSDLTAQQFESGYDFAPFDPGDDVIVGPDKQGQCLFSPATTQTVLPPKLIGALIGNGVAAATVPAAQLPQVTFAGYSRPQLSSQPAALLPVGGGQVFAGNKIVSLLSRAEDITAAQWIVGEELAAVISLPQASTYPAFTAVPTIQNRSTDLTAQAWSLVEEPAAIIAPAPTSAAMQAVNVLNYARLQVDLTAQKWLVSGDQTALLPVGGGQVFAGVQISRLFQQRFADTYLPSNAGQAIYSQSSTSGYVPSAGLQVVQQPKASSVAQHWLIDANGVAPLYVQNSSYVYDAKLHLARIIGLDRSSMAIASSPIAAQLWIAPPPSTLFVSDRMAIVDQQIRVAIVVSTARNITVH